MFESRGSCRTRCLASADSLNKQPNTPITLDVGRTMCCFPLLLYCLCFLFEAFYILCSEAPYGGFYPVEGAVEGLLYQSAL